MWLCKGADLGNLEIGPRTPIIGDGVNAEGKTSRELGSGSTTVLPIGQPNPRVHTSPQNGFPDRGGGGGGVKIEKFIGE